MAADLVDGVARRCAVLGDPIAHSLSPVLHRAGYAATGLDWSYAAHRVAGDGLEAFLAGLDATWRGLSLTMPLKRAAMRLDVEVSSRAALVGAANTLVLEGGRVVLADNTDLPGAGAALRERYDGPVREVTLLGGGATAASTGLAMCDLGAEAITLLVRSAARAQETVDAIARHPSEPRIRVAELDTTVATGDVLVSTVPASAQTPELVARCAQVPVVFEVLYDPWPTPLARAASTSGRPLVGGLDLLVHQAALQFELFTGRPAPLAILREAGESALASAGGPA
ncbi:shikimate dehydrogenase [Nocardioides sp.]|uniref:shikimate dehydrogenase n=1 Tax=Nocardioides sp. TaxID=35761 RepID=UPI0035642983